MSRIVVVVTRAELEFVVREILQFKPDKPLTLEMLSPVYSALSKIGIAFTGCDDLERLNQV